MSGETIQCGPLELRYSAARVERIFLPEFDSRGVELFILRGDLMHSVVTGNKLWKLKYNLMEAARLGKKRLVTFGGAYSNHLLATAFVSSVLGFQSLGVLRGDERIENPVLSKCRELGMEFLRVSRAAYRQKEELIEQHRLQTPENYLLPEGGSNILALRGCAEVIAPGSHFDHLLVAAATGGTLAGLTLSVSPNTMVEGIAVLKGASFLEQQIKSLVPGSANWKVHLNFHHGGFARRTMRLDESMSLFTGCTGIPLDPIYTGKMAFAAVDLAERGYFKTGSKVLLVHTGGGVCL